MERGGCAFGRVPIHQRRALPIRIVVAFGHLFGGFRVAFRAGFFGLDWPEGFAVLEATALQELRWFAALSPERRARLKEDPLPLRPGPQLGDRTGVVDVAIGPEDEQGTLVAMLALFPFRLWPLGGWAALAAGRITPEGRLELVDQEELQGYW